MEPHWGYCGICDESLRPPFHGLRDPPWPNLTIYEWVQLWFRYGDEDWLWVDLGDGVLTGTWAWDYDWQYLPCHASCVMVPRAGGS